MDINRYEEEVFSHKREIFEKLRKMLIEYNEKYNLTSITEEKDVYYKHFLDSVLGAGYFQENARVIEIGSGAGFPSIPLKIIRPDLRLDLVESVGKKCEFLRTVVDNLGLKDVHIYNGRAEEYAKDVKFREKYNHATARAVARMNTLSEYCLPFVEVGGTFIAYKSGETEEIYEADSAYKTLGGVLQDVCAYALPRGYGQRTIAVVKKVKKTPDKYPRGQGKERKNPL